MTFSQSWRRMTTNITKRADLEHEAKVNFIFRWYLIGVAFRVENV